MLIAVTTLGKQWRDEEEMAVTEDRHSGAPSGGRRDIHLVQVPPNRFDRAKRAFTTRRVPLEALRSLVYGPVRPRPGNLVLARIDRLGQHKKLELTTGRRATLHVGDEIVVAYANRYAPDQYESHVPLDLRRTQLVASGGIASGVLSRSRDVRTATDIAPVALIGDERGIPLNLNDFALSPSPPAEQRPATVAVVGSSMNSGKTTTIHRMVVGLARAGHRPGVTKVTGTGSGGDYWVMGDAGAHEVLDFTDAGLASTYHEDMAVVERTMVQLTDHLVEAGCGSILMEVADGALQQETSRLIDTSAFQERVDGVVFAAPDALSAIGGVRHLRAIGLPVLAVAGRLTRSPLATREAQAALDVPILTLDELGHPMTASRLFKLPSPRHVDPKLLLDKYEPDTAVIDLTEPDVADVVDPIEGGLGWNLPVDVRLDGGSL